MPILNEITLKLRTLKYSTFNSNCHFAPLLYYCKLLLKLLKIDTNTRYYGIKSYSQHFGWIQHRQLCSAAQSMNNQSNKILAILQSKVFETESKLNVNSFFDSVCESKELSVIEWDSLKEQLLKISGIYNEINFNGLIMKNLALKNNYDLACSFMSYLKAKNEQPNVFTLSTFMKLCGQNIKKCGEEDIISMYHKIKNLKVMDSTLIENVVSALSVTSHWKEGYKIYKEADVCISLPVLKLIACAAFSHHNFEVALELIKEIETSDINDLDIVYIEWLNAIFNIHLKNPQESSLLLDKLLMHLLSKEVIVSKKTAELISHYFESLKAGDWKGTFVTMSKKMTCPNCNRPLQLLGITKDQHQMLKEAILSKIVKGSDVFLNTTPAELDRFKKFLMSTIPYDIVIDGLNVAFYYLHNCSNLERARQLFLVVDHFASHKGMKTLVLGRKHMKTWPKKFMEPISRMANVFYADNVSKDDPFILYATLMSGPQTMVLTKDLLRNYKFWLQDSLLSTYFERWRKTHQVFLTRVNASGSIVYEEPLPYSIIVQGSMEEGWHIPCKLSDDDKPKSVYDFHRNWLCINKK